MARWFDAPVVLLLPVHWAIEATVHIAALKGCIVSACASQGRVAEIGIVELAFLQISVGQIRMVEVGLA